MRYARRVTAIATQIRQEVASIDSDLEDASIERETEIGYNFDYGCGL